MRILALSPEPDLPEAHLLAGLAGAGANITWLGRAGAKNLGILTASGINTGQLEFGSRISLSSIKALKDILASRPFDIIHSFTARALSNALWATRRSGVKNVAYRGTIGHLSRLDPTAWLSFLNSRLTRISCVSEAVRQYLIGQGVSPERAVRIYKGHDPTWYKAAPREILTQFGIPADACVFACVANMRPVKGIDILLAAFESLIDMPSAHLLLIGEVREEKINNLVKSNANQNRIHLAGFRADATAILGACDVAVMVSREREGLPKSILEGMAQGLPALVSDVGGMPELVQANRSGLVVPASDSIALAQALKKLAGDTNMRRDFGTEAKKRIQEVFNIKQTIQQTLTLYQDCLAQ